LTYEDEEEALVALAQELDIDKTYGDKRGPVCHVKCPVLAFLERAKKRVVSLAVVARASNLTR
jgi:hypothetical protein